MKEMVFPTHNSLFSLHPFISLILGSLLIVSKLEQILLQILYVPPKSDYHQ